MAYGLPSSAERRLDIAGGLSHLASTIRARSDGIGASDTGCFRLQPAWGDRFAENCRIESSDRKWPRPGCRGPLQIISSAVAMHHTPVGSGDSDRRQPEIRHSQERRSMVGTRPIPDLVVRKMRTQNVFEPNGVERAYWSFVITPFPTDRFC